MPKSTHPHWFTYILQCADKTYYTGLTYDLDHRVQVHNSGKGATYTRGRGPVKLVHSEKFNNYKDAAQREFAIKKLTRLQKEDLLQNKIK
ncbi:GIY-YIG nuclease family protein [Patescibacteria group bacterium]|nr:GIY-YIG nuclease family protein [Patescibacteria group bacterium]